MLQGNKLGLALALIIVSGGHLMVEAAGGSGSKYQTYGSHARTTSKFIAHDFVPDGNVDKPVWHGAPWIKVDHDSFQPVTFPQSAVDIASLWTPQYVYFAFRCQYTTLNVYDDKDTSKDFWQLWDRDVVEIFLNPQPEHMRHYYEFEVAPNNLWIDLEIDLDKKPFGNAKWDSGFEHATRVDAANHVWTCELRIPVAALTGDKPLAANTEWRINFFRADGQGDDTKRRFLSWSLVHNDTDSFHAPWSFGVIRFVK
jgi:alpha-galactosidase